MHLLMLNLRFLKFLNIPVLRKYEIDANPQCTYFLFRVKMLAVASLNHAEQVGAIQFLYHISKIKI